MDEIFYKLIEKIKKYNPQANFDLITKAYRFSSGAHEGQQRLSGEPFIVHPLAVADILADMEMDTLSLIHILKKTRILFFWYGCRKYQVIGSMTANTPAPMA